MQPTTRIQIIQPSNPVASKLVILTDPDGSETRYVLNYDQDFDLTITLVPYIVETGITSADFTSSAE